MKHISILVPEGEVILSSIVGPYKVFTKVNELLVSMGRPAAFKMTLVGLTHRTVVYDGLFSIQPEKKLGEIDHTDLVIIPAVQGDLRVSLERNAAFVPWITRKYKDGAEIASLCVGSFFLAATGLMKGKKCATHWMAANAFRMMYPDVHLVADKIITDENGIYTSGGAYSFLNLLLHLVEKYCGRAIAIQCAKMFEIDIDRNSQSPFAIFNGQKEHDDEPVRKAQCFIEQHIREKITVSQLALEFALSRRNLERRFKKATSNTPVEYMQRVRIEAAKKILESGRENINEVMYGVGYTDTKAFRCLFKKITGLSPLEYRNKYNREMMMA